jgi:signal transduction histidine kinase
MQPAPAKKLDSDALERLGGATLQIVHDLKNQLNGLKLYATFLRKRLDRDDQPQDERETLAKLISGLDRAAKDLTALVRYARPLDLRRQTGVDVKRIVTNVIAEAAERETGGLPKVTIAANFEGDSFIGEFDAPILSEAIKAITDDVRATISAKVPQPISIIMRRESNHAEIEWRGGHFNMRNTALPNGCGTIHTELATKIIQAQGGDVICEDNVIRVTLPLSTQ